MGAEKDIIVAVELGSTAIRAIAGRRQPDGTMQVLAIAQEDATSSIRKGVVDNIEKTKQAISHVITRLNDRLGIYTTRVYVGLSGQSLHTKLNKVPYQLTEKTQISNKIVDQLKEFNNGVVYPDAKILDVIPQEYGIGQRNEADPVGLMTDSIEARFLNVVASCALSENIEKCVRGAGVELAELLISPICLADALMSPSEKRSGCALVDVGAETTTVSVYTNNILRHLAVIPLGGFNVTRDITDKKVEFEEAEQLKLKYGTARRQDTDSTDNTNNRSIQLSYNHTIQEDELQAIIEARYEEILANAWAHIKPYNDKILSGIILTGGGCRIKDIVQAFTDKSHTDKSVRQTKALPNNIVLAQGVKVDDGDNLLTLMALLQKGDQTCVGEPPKDENEAAVQGTINFEEPVDEIKAKPEEPTPLNDEAPKKTKPGTFRRFWDKLNDMLTDEERDDNV